MYFFINRNVFALLVTLAVVPFIFLLSPPVFSQDGPSTYRVVSISTDGNKFYDSKTIILNSGLKAGEELTVPSEETRDAIMRLWNLNIFSDIQILVDKKIGTDAYLVIKVKELPKLDNIKFTGNDEFSNKDLREKIPLSKGQVITPQTVKDIEYNIKKIYIDEGYPLVEVSVDQFVNTYNEAQLRVKIEEGSEISVQRIRFEGNKNISSDDLRGAMEETSEDRWWKFWDKARFNRENYEKDKQFIIDYYREKGYKDATIVGDKLTYTHNKEDVTITIKVNEGPKYRVGKISFIGNSIYKDSLLFERLDFKRGDVYNVKKFQQNLRGNESQTDVASLYLDNGYLGFNAEVREEDAGRNIIDITVVIRENRQYRIGLINFSGNTKTQDKIIRRELFTIPGRYFNIQK